MQLYASTHKVHSVDTLHSDALAFLRILTRSDAFTRTLIHLCTQMHSYALVCIRMHSYAFVCIRMHFHAYSLLCLSKRTSSMKAARTVWLTEAGTYTHAKKSSSLARGPRVLVRRMPMARLPA